MTAKRGTLPGDVVLIHFQGKPASFARVEGVRAHPRPGWSYCDLLVLAVPPQPVTWILERDQIDGADFTMGGQPVRLERLPDPGKVHAARQSAESRRATAKEAPPEAAPPAEQPAAGEPVRHRRAPRRGNVVPLFPRQD